MIKFNYKCDICGNSHEALVEQGTEDDERRCHIENCDGKVHRTEDIYENDEQISLGQLYYEEQQENLKLEQNNFEMVNCMYDGKRE